MLHEAQRILLLAGLCVVMFLWKSLGLVPGTPYKSLSLLDPRIKELRIYILQPGSILKSKAGRTLHISMASRREEEWDAEILKGIKVSKNFPKTARYLGFDDLAKFRTYLYSHSFLDY